MVKYWKIIFIFGLILAFYPQISRADRVNVMDWYIKDYQTDITLNQDNSLDIVENIVADCGSCIGKHGIYRVLPTTYKTDTGTFQTPIELKSITNFANQPLKYTTSRPNLANKTITWKIGDPEVRVTGINNYRISYNIKNPVRANSDFDELYWNLSGNYWQLEIDHFSATMHFPTEITQDNAKLSLYSGVVTSKDNKADYTWIDKNTLKVDYNQTLALGEGVTMSATFPKSIIAPYSVEFNYWNLVWIFIPILVWFGCIILWFKYGRDPNLHRTIVPEFSVPAKLSPMKMGAVMSQGDVPTTAIAASIISLAVNGLITIEETKTKGILGIGGKKEFIFKRTKKSDVLLSPEEKQFLNYFMAKTDTRTIQDIKDELFYEKVPMLKDMVKKDLQAEGVFSPTGFSLKIAFLSFGAIFFIGGFIILFASQFSDQLLGLGIDFIISGAIIFLFGFLMPRFTEKGKMLLLQIRGFELYMKTAEKYRQQFNEKENIFELLLPYAILFGLTKHWAKVAEEFKGAKYMSSYYPIWYIGGVPGNFNIDNVASQISTISNQISSAPSSSSGAGGGGFSGGGGGGGGGGGW